MDLFRTASVVFRGPFSSLSLSMARRKKSVRSEEEGGFGLNPETKRGIAVVFLFVLAALLLLSFFGAAGKVGNTLDDAMALVFGWDRFLVPVLLVVFSFTVLFPERSWLSGWNRFGLALFLVSFNGLMNLFLLFRFPPVVEDVSQAGGLLGELLGGLLPGVLGFWGALVVMCGLLLAAVLLVFNMSLRSLVAAHGHLSGWFGEKAHLKESEDDWKTPPEDEEEDEEDDVRTSPDPEPEPEDDEETEEEDEEDAPPIKGKPVSRGVMDPPSEQVLTTKEQRQINLSLDLLDNRSTKANSGNVERAKEIIQRTFQQFNIDVEMGETATGPTVTQYTLRPAQGVKLARVVGLQNDLALALAAHPIRIEAPIPGKSLVGIEVPNQTVATVALREIMESKAFTGRKSNLSIPLGKDVMGLSWVVALDKMPHLLVAGATGSGKSVCLNTLIVGLLYENGPDELKFIMVDPKRVELSVYAGIPHLLVPPIVKSEDAVNALKWTVREMERRLDVLGKFGARDITSYNNRAEEKMPKIVVVIDELADLMATSGREVEATIVRIAQMARAVGIHLVLATQRPSVDVITGTIKANIPARIAFSVASQTDSRTILDVSGAEKLLGRGDMLYWSAELSKPKRLQGPYVSEDEVGRIVDALKKEGAPDYNHAVTEASRSATVMGGGSDAEEPLLDEAVQAIIEAGRASTSLLQRRLKVGYGRAARIMDLLEEKGVIGPGEGAKPREVLVTSWPPDDGVEGMPTAQDDLDEAEEKPKKHLDEEEETEDADEEEETEEDEEGEEEQTNKKEF